MTWDTCWGKGSRHRLLPGHQIPSIGSLPILTPFLLSEGRDIHVPRIARARPGGRNDSREAEGPRGGAPGAPPPTARPADADCHHGSPQLMTIGPRCDSPPASGMPLHASRSGGCAGPVVVARPSPGHSLRRASCRSEAMVIHRPKTVAGRTTQFILSGPTSLGPTLASPRPSDRSVGCDQGGRCGGRPRGVPPG